jgi:hypothetical protein
MIAVGVLAVIPVITSRLVDEGEVVELSTFDEHGREHMTEVWIVDLPSGTYLRAGAPEAEWLARVRIHPEVEIVRADQPERFRAVPDEDAEARRLVNTAMAEKYGFADELWSHFADRERSVPIRLHPLGTAAAVP